MNEPLVSRRRVLAGAAAAGACAIVPLPARAQKKYGPGVSDTEIRVGQTIAYSGPASAYGQIGRAEAAYFRYLNDRGGINGRKINFISLDDGYSPPKAVEMTRKLVEQDEVALMFGMLGTPLNMATRGYLNVKKVPTLFVAAGSSNFANPEKFPWTIGFQPTLTVEGGFFARQILALQGTAKIGVLYQDDDFGKELLAGLRAGLGDKAGMVVGTESFQPGDPTVDSQIIALKGAGADTLMIFAYAKQAAQAIRKYNEIGWKPAVYLHSGASSVTGTLIPAGLQNSTGINTAQYSKDISDPQYQSDPEVKPYFEWLKKYMADQKADDTFNFSGWMFAQALEQVLRQCGDDLTRENIMKQAASLKGYRNPALLPGSLIDTAPNDYRVVEHMRLARFNGKSWEGR